MSRLFNVLLLAVLTSVATSAQANQPPKAVASVGGDPGTGQVLHSVTLYIGPSDTVIPYTISGAGSPDPDDASWMTGQAIAADGGASPMGTVPPIEMQLTQPVVEMTP